MKHKKPYLCLNCGFQLFEFVKPKKCYCDKPIIKRILTEDDRKKI